jgi:hypothetical protein
VARGTGSILLALLLLASCRKPADRGGDGRSIKPESAPSSAPSALPSSVLEGFHRHDKAPEPALSPNGPPSVGQYVKVQINLKEPLACANYPGESSDWLAMGGKVETVLSPTRVRVALVATTDRYPRAFDGNWIGTLERRSGLEHPWVLVALSPDAPDASAR